VTDDAARYLLPEAENRRIFVEEIVADRLAGRLSMTSSSPMTRGQPVTSGSNGSHHRHRASLLWPHRALDLPLSSS